jgi:hypothetical protein
MKTALIIAEIVWKSNTLLHSKALKYGVTEKLNEAKVIEK